MAFGSQTILSKKYKLIYNEWSTLYHHIATNGVCLSTREKHFTLSVLCRTKKQLLQKEQTENPPEGHTNSNRTISYVFKYNPDPKLYLKKHQESIDVQRKRLFFFLKDLITIQTRILRQHVYFPPGTTVIDIHQIRWRNFPSNKKSYHKLRKNTTILATTNTIRRKPRYRVIITNSFHFLDFWSS